MADAQIEEVREPCEASVSEHCTSEHFARAQEHEESDEEVQFDQPREPHRKSNDGESGTKRGNSEDVAFLIQEASNRLNHEMQRNAHLEAVLTETEKHFVEQMRKLHEEKAEMEAQIRKLTTEKTRLMSDLEESKNVLFELRPEEQVSDAEIQGRYTELCGAIETWIDLATDGDDVEDFGARFLKLWKKMRRPNPIYNALGDLESDLPNLMAHDNFDYFVLTALIQGSLDTEMAIRYPIGISQTVLTVLKEVQRGMAMLEPPKDKSYIGTWRSDALKALTSIQEVKEARDAHAEECTRDLLATLLKPLLSKSADLETLESKLLGNVIKPAFELSEMMCISTHRYAIRYPKKVSSGIVPKNLDGWTTVKKLESIERAVRRLHPALLLLDRGEHFPVVLVKPVVVVSLRKAQ
ncbi:hypothetical protein FGG08_006333 [Glutinoglossum americanum]|uniref:Uncharacterized protein n=1 Tax=Glutinoglossum americanum TaxID=1670608 RepID=A0A9P8I1H8_9PEZI|nr:hypothetical protein FGG08_006333 [Glutinoglossum americanum]